VLGRNLAGAEGTICGSDASGTKAPQIASPDRPSTDASHSMLADAAYDATRKTHDCMLASRLSWSASKGQMERRSGPRHDTDPWVGK
jgi:hypothetical protein